MKTRLQPIVRTTLVMLLATMIGLHWGALQLAAWTGMMISYSQKSGLITGVSQTFDGKHPCTLCKVIQKQSVNQEEQGPTTPPVSDLKSNLFPFLTRLLIGSQATSLSYPSAACFYPSRSETPLLLPPRSILA